MRTKFLTKAKEVILKAKNAIVCAAIAVPATAMIFCTNVMAAGDDSQIINSINNLEQLVLDIIQAAGVIITAWGVFEFANGYQSHDGTQQSTGLKRVIAGVLMFFAGTIMGLLNVG